MEPADVHHIVCLVGHHGHDLEGQLQSFGLLYEVGSVGVLEDGLQQHVVLGQTLDRFYQQVRQPKLVPVLQPDFLREKKMY